MSLVEQPLLPDLLQRPPLGLDEVVLICDVGMLHIRPEADDIGELLPHTLVLPDGLTAFLDERLDAVLLDLLLAVDADRLLDLQLDGQSMRVPARLAEHLAPLHRLIARQHILDDTRQNVPDMRAAVRRRRAVVKRERIAALTLVNGTLCNMILAPKIRNGFLARGKIQICIYFFVQRNPSRSIHSHAILARERRFFKEQALTLFQLSMYITEPSFPKYCTILKCIVKY